MFVVVQGIWEVHNMPWPKFRTGKGEKKTGKRNLSTSSVLFSVPNKKNSTKLQVFTFSRPRSVELPF